MFDERAFIARVEAAGPDEFARLLARPGPEEERALRAHLGEERYQRLHAMAMRRGVRSTRRASAGNVVVIHGIMGGELSTRAAGEPGGGGGDHVWARLLSLVRGRVARLRLAEDGRSDFDAAVAVEATGIMKRSYGEILLALADRWAVRAFWFDWRKDLTLAGNELAAKVTAWFGAAPEQPVHIVAHSMGGLVARTFVMNHAAQWERMGGRLVMLGTPNYGSYAIPQVITGLEGMVRKLALVDLSHDVGDLLPVFNSFAGSYQMLPSPQRLAELKVDGDWMYDATSYAPVPSRSGTSTRRARTTPRSTRTTRRWARRRARGCSTSPATTSRRSTAWRRRTPATAAPTRSPTAATAASRTTSAAWTACARTTWRKGTATCRATRPCWARSRTCSRAARPTRCRRASPRAPGCAARRRSTRTPARGCGPGRTRSWSGSARSRSGRSRAAPTPCRRFRSRRSSARWRSAGSRASSRRRARRGGARSRRWPPPRPRGSGSASPTATSTRPTRCRPPSCRWTRSPSDTTSASGRRTPRPPSTRRSARRCARPRADPRARWTSATACSRSTPTAASCAASWRSR